MSRHLTVVDDEGFASTAARHIARAIIDRLRIAPDCSLALTGGATARAVYEHLADQTNVSIAWNAVTFYFGDERAVPPDDPRSNYRLARETLLSPFRITPRADSPHGSRAPGPRGGSPGL